MSNGMRHHGPEQQILEEGLGGRGGLEYPISWEMTIVSTRDINVTIE